MGREGSGKGTGVKQEHHMFKQQSEVHFSWIMRGREEMGQAERGWGQSLQPPGRNYHEGNGRHGELVRVGGGEKREGKGHVGVLGTV